MLYVVAFLLLIGILMIPHEWGHYIVARRAGMKVYEYSIGIGPEIISRIRDGVKFSLRPIPVAAFVRIAGMEPGEADHPDGFNSKSIPWRFAVLIAGSTMNMFVALVAFVIVGMVYGKIVGSTSVVENVDRRMPAYRAGFQPGDRIVAVDEKRVSDVPEIQRIIHAHPSRPVKVLVERAGKEVPLEVIPDAIATSHKDSKTGRLQLLFQFLKGFIATSHKDSKTGRSEAERVGMIGILFSPVYRRVGLFESVEDGFTTTVDWTATIIYNMGYIFTHKEGLKAVGGPVAIAREAGESAKRGTREYLQMVGVISINLALFNMLPFLALDGGRILFLVYELVRRKKVDPHKEFLANAIGMGFLLLLILLITAKDIRDLILK